MQHIDKLEWKQKTVKHQKWKQFKTRLNGKVVFHLDGWQMMYQSDLEMDTEPRLPPCCLKNKYEIVCVFVWNIVKCFAQPG